MFMLTHTYFLQKVLASAEITHADLDIFVYNIAPDLLTIHPRITANQTHAIERSLQVPEAYSKSAYTMFHLLVDDLSHYGYICSGRQEEFNADSSGYCDLKGRDLVEPIMDLHKQIGKRITFNDAVYQSHLIIEMIYDLVIAKQIDDFKTIHLLVEAIHFTVEHKMDEFAASMNWLYGLDKNDVHEAMQTALRYVTREGMDNLMNMKGRINLYQDKFGLKSDNRLFYDGLENMFRQAINLIDDDELFFLNSMQMIKQHHSVSILDSLFHKS